MTSYLIFGGGNWLGKEGGREEGEKKRNEREGKKGEKLQMLSYVFMPH